MAGAPKGNKNHEIWTFEDATKYMELVLNYVIENTDCVSIQEAACNTGEYKDVITYLERKYNIEFSTIKRANSIIEERTYKNALSGKYNSTMAIFGLKNNHGWKDKTETDITTNGKELNLTGLSTDELIKRAAAMQLIEKHE